MVVNGKLTAKVIEKTVSEVSKQQQGIRPEQGPSPFQNVLDSIIVGEELAGKLGMMDNHIGDRVSQVQALPADGITVDKALLERGVNSPDGASTVVDLISEVNHGHMRMENLIQQLMQGGKRFNNQELLAIQAHVYHIAQVTELVVKTADQGVGSVKAVLNTNIQ